MLELSSPRAWVARCAWPGGAREARDSEFPRQACVTLRSASAREPTVEPGVARIVAEGASWLTVEAEGPGWLVTTQPWYPGWTAQAAGAALPLEPVDGALVGVRLPAGSTTVALSYRPAGLDRGLMVSGLAARSWPRSGTSAARDRRSDRRALGAGAVLAALFADDGHPRCGRLGDGRRDGRVWHRRGCGGDGGARVTSLARSTPTCYVSRQ